MWRNVLSRPFEGKTKKRREERERERERKREICSDKVIDEEGFADNRTTDIKLKEILR